MMTDRVSPRISTRKQPKQSRSNDLVTAIIQAAHQVLEQEGVQRFTTARVAERAGVSVGSLYQYFPNKAAILFRLQSDEWRQTSNLLGEILADRSKPPLKRLHGFVHAFISSECEEAAVRAALGEVAPHYRAAPEARDARAENDVVIEAFLSEAIPNASMAVRAQVGDLVMATMTTVGKGFSAEPKTDAQIAAYANAMSDMFCAYIRYVQDQ